MEMHFIYAVFFSVAVLVLGYVSVASRTMSTVRNCKAKLPPGPNTLPLIGNLHQMVGSMPHHYFKELALEYGPISRVYVGEVLTVIISSVDAAKEVLLTQEKNFPQRPVSLVGKIVIYDKKGLVFSPYGDHWRKSRKIAVTELLSTKRVGSFLSIREEETRDLIDSVAATRGAVFNLTEKFSGLITCGISRAAFGERCQQQDRFLSLLDEIVALGGGFSLTDAFPSLRFLSTLTGVKRALLKIKHELDTILDEILYKHTKIKGLGGTRDDIVDVLLKLQDSTSDQDDFHLTLNDIKAILLDIFLAGSETSATALDWVMAAMLKHPEVMERAQSEVRAAFRGQGNAREESSKELSYLRSVIKETLRLYPPFPLIPRLSIRHCEIRGYDIPPETRVVINSWAIGRDPEFWKDAERFMPERFLGNPVGFLGADFEFLPFGAGRRMCPGIAFALASIELPLSQLLYHFDWKLPEGATPEQLDMAESFGGTCRRKEALNVVAIPITP
ncbi:hypothetical protein MLD38_009073 [Melastoma candidum]|uniref:Uncharacterized protein n=1 Tax=Melastoma candidum TaxID=119954 RepID=A0ACB9RVI6_9MYRT|nr:hypothetical protein MLD38_009073 [Melastoma candidum]